jgi:hypothetical protein
MFYGTVPKDPKDASVKPIPLALFIAMTALTGTSTQAADGCKVLLCLAGNWRHIEQCVPPVEQALRDLALGRSYPSCDMSQNGPVNAPSSQTASAASALTTQTTCPPMYSLYSQENNNWIGCTYVGVISLMVNGASWTDTYWDMTGETSTHFYDVARAALPTVDPTYDNDLAAYLATQPPTPAVPHEGS